MEPAERNCDTCMKVMFGILAVGRLALAVGLSIYAGYLLSGGREFKTARGISTLSATEALVAGVFVALLALGAAASIWLDVEQWLAPGVRNRRQRLARGLMVGSIMSAMGIVLLVGAVAFIWEKV